ncbi:hypothetical protein BDV98DRAFT_564077 [Pterulicium gracile]|uniref:F-box domain-containing protein n=1 Tax=Pterulicium gracile TaxID=1884261 RepID=A0A5C3QN01_9AGAR|nr:hypothetical protein BDV98DRAFT_564077 [Pterula gracilis]
MPPRAKKVKTRDFPTGVTLQLTKSPRKPKAVRVDELRGKLKYMTDIPLELLSEILAYVQPVDLMNLARADKVLRGILLSRSARPIWIKALEICVVPTWSEISEPLSDADWGKHRPQLVRELPLSEATEFAVPLVGEVLEHALLATTGGMSTTAGRVRY